MRTELCNLMKNHLNLENKMEMNATTPDLLTYANEFHYILSCTNTLTQIIIDMNQYSCGLSSAEF